MISRVGRQGHLVNVTGGTQVAVVKVPKDPGSRIPVGCFEDGSAEPSVKFYGNIQRTPFPRVYQAYGPGAG